MDEAESILLTSLSNSGVALPSIHSLAPDHLVSITAQSLNLIDTSFNFNDSMPDSMTDRVELCTDLADGLKKVGYYADISFHQFLYPSEDDSYKLIRFLVEKLSGTLVKPDGFGKEKFGAPARVEESIAEASLSDLTEKFDNFGVNHYKKVPSTQPAVDSVVSGEDSHANEHIVKEKLLTMKEIELATEAVILEIQKRDKEISKLSVELEKQPKVASRKSYIQRIIEITKNSRKQDGDIERILKDTRELQLESNSIQERLHRTYAVVDETLLREAKNDPVREQAYKILTNIHGSFEQISQKIIATDRLRREISEQEVKLSTVATRSLNTEKLQSDLEAIRKENMLLEEQLLRN